MERFKRRNKDGKQTAKAGITVFMSLMILLMISFAAAVLESASIQTAKNIRRADVERAVESVFAEYQKELLEEYDIFGLDGTYETGEYSEDNVLERMAVFGAVSEEGTMKAVRFLSDDEGSGFAEQVCHYMEQQYGLDELEDIFGNEEHAIEQEREAEEYQKKEREVEEEIDTILASQNVPVEEGEDVQDNPLEKLQSLKGKLLTEISLPGGRRISQKSMEGIPGVSSRERRTGRGAFPATAENEMEKLYLISYSSEHFGSYLQSWEDHPLEYEREYLIGGKSDDVSNLQIVLDKIRKLRMVPNYLYLQSDETKKAEAKVLAGVISTVMGNPELTDAVCEGILMMWAYGESIMDLRALAAGGKIPAVKGKDTWKLSLSGLLQLGTKEDGGDSQKEEEGLGYEEYLNILLFLESKEVLRMRMLDLIEWNMRLRLECPFFQADACITKVRIESLCHLRRGITYRFSTYYAYQ